MKENKIYKLFKDLYFRFTNDELLSTSAEVAFFMLLSLFPFLIFLINLLSFTAIESLVDNLEILSEIMPLNAYLILKEIIKQAIAHRNGTLLSFGMLFTLWSSTSGVTTLIKGINRAYDQEETRPFWRIIIIALYITIELALAIIFSLLLIVFGKILGKYILNSLGLSRIFLTIWNYIRFLIAFIGIFFIFTSLYHHTPNKKLSLKESIPGAILASIGIVTISIGFSFYANNFGNYADLYGSLAGIIVLQTWIYISSIVFLFGAEINSMYLFKKLGIKKEKLKRF